MVHLAITQTRGVPCGRRNVRTVVAVSLWGRCIRCAFAPLQEIGGYSSEVSEHEIDKLRHVQAHCARNLRSLPVVYIRDFWSQSNVYLRTLSTFFDVFFVEREQK